MKKAIIITLAVLGAGIGLIWVGKSAETREAEARNRAFLESMVPHHESAIAMARVAQTRAETPEIKKLANEIVEAQEAEIAQIKQIHRRLFGTELTPDERAHEQLGLSAAEAGMNHGAASTQALQTANPLDRAFIDEMTPHHEGAIRMAQEVLETTDDTELEQLAEAIIRVQEGEIRLMARVRLRDYGSATRGEPTAPAGVHEAH